MTINGRAPDAGEGPGAPPGDGPFSAPGEGPYSVPGPGREPDAGGATWSVDLHLHTSASYDCRSDPADVVRVAREAGLDRIAVTDHNEIRGALEARASDPELVIVGEEVRTAEGPDLIGLFLTQRIPEGTPFRVTAQMIREQGGVVYLPHPFDRFRGVGEALLREADRWIDVVEGFNARVHDHSRNERAVRWAEERGLPLGAGSDAHLLREIGRGRLVLPPFHRPEDFLRAARDGRIDGETSSPLVHVGSTWAKLRNSLPI